MVPIGTQHEQPNTNAQQAPEGIVETARSVWEYDLFSVQGGIISVGMIILGIALFLFGFVAARVISNVLAKRVVKKMGATEGGIAAIQTLTFYALLALFSFFALNVVGVPLTAFTVFGGALAIGVGFGSQNIINNFISGLILNLERPVKVGDVIEVGDTRGVVEQIGARSTRVITADNTHIIVPNSTFVEQNVMNWSYNDRSVRISVGVGVAYGSPTKDVERLLLKAGREHPKAHTTPDPNVRFESFGASSLDFVLHVWMSARSPSEARLVESDLRFRIDELFRENEITIAFPQSDVHLDATSPVPVRVIRSDDAIAVG